MTIAMLDERAADRHEGHTAAAGPETGSNVRHTRSRGRPASAGLRPELGALAHRYWSWPDGLLTIAEEPAVGGPVTRSVAELRLMVDVLVPSDASGTRLTPARVADLERASRALGSALDGALGRLTHDRTELVRLIAAAERAGAPEAEIDAAWTVHVAITGLAARIERTGIAVDAVLHGLDDLAEGGPVTGLDFVAEAIGQVRDRLDAVASYRHEATTAISRALTACDGNVPR